MEKHHKIDRDESTRIFLFIAVFLFIVLALQSSNDKNQLLADSDVLVTHAYDYGGGGALAFIQPDQSLDEEAFVQAASKDYEQLKQELGVKSDFIIRIEDMNGNPVSVNGKSCLGDPRLCPS